MSFFGQQQQQPMMGEPMNGQVGTYGMNGEVGTYGMNGQMGMSGVNGQVGIAGQPVVGAPCQTMDGQKGTYKKSWGSQMPTCKSNSSWWGGKGKGKGKSKKRGGQYQQQYCDPTTGMDSYGRPCQPGMMRQQMFGGQGFPQQYQSFPQGQGYCGDGITQYDPVTGAPCQQSGMYGGQYGQAAYMDPYGRSYGQAMPDRRQRGGRTMRGGYKASSPMVGLGVSAAPYSGTTANAHMVGGRRRKGRKSRKARKH